MSGKGVHKRVSCFLGLLILWSGPAAAYNDGICAKRTKVVGGWSTTWAAWPSFAELRLRSPGGKEAWHHCGGTAIASEWILTAAHCLFDVSRLDRPLKIDRTTKGRFADVYTGGILQVIMGVGDLSKVGPGNVYDVAEVILHEDYGGRPAWDGNDIALIRLARPWPGEVMRLSLSRATDPDDRSILLVAGFGDTYDRAIAPAMLQSRFDVFETFEPLKYVAGSQILRETFVPVVPAPRCKVAYPNAAIGDQQICAGYERGGRDSCQGDSGGPLTLRDQNGCPYQAGIVSWGEGCARRRLYGVYTRVSAHEAWLHRHLDNLIAATNPYVPSPNHDPERLALVTMGLGQLKHEPGLMKKVAIVADHQPVFRLGSQYTFIVTSEMGGRLILLDVDAVGSISQIFPNRFEKAYERSGLMAPGVPTTIPPQDSGTAAFVASEPTGQGRVVAIVVPESFPWRFTLTAPKVQEAVKGFRPVPNQENYFLNVLDQVVSYCNGALKEASEPRCDFGILGYEIVE